MTNARSWTQPSPEEVREMLARTGLLREEIAARCDVSVRRVRYWITPVAPESKRISYHEWLALRALVEGEK